MKKHLAIMSKTFAEAVLSGKKTVETRFSQNKISPFGQVSKGDLVYIKLSGGDIVGQFRVKKVISYEGLDLSDLSYLRTKYGKEIAADEDYWVGKEKTKYGTLIFIDQSERFITSPIKIKKNDQRGWMVLYSSKSA